jgi:DNA-binding response OmpR family regulator
MSLAPESQSTGHPTDFVFVPERNAERIGVREVAVSKTQFRILAFLMGKPDQTLSRLEIVEHAIAGLVTERTVDVHIKQLRDVHIKQLRDKLGPMGSRIETVRGQGYRFRVTRRQPVDPPP